MANIKAKSTAQLRVILSCGLLIGVALGASQLRAQDGKALDAPVSTPPAVPSHPVAASVTRASILRKAESAYYILQTQGLKSFQCDITPDWPALITDPAQLALVGKIQYSAVIDDQGAAQVTPFLPSGAPIDASQNQMVSGMQQTISGFFQTWNSLMLSPVFSATTDDQLVYSVQPDGYHFAQKNTDTNVDIVMTADGVMTTMKVVTADSVIVMYPKYTKTDAGLVLTSMNSDINHSTQKVNFQIDYQIVEGFALPQKVSYQVVLPTQTIAVDVSLADYKIVKN